MNDVGIIIISIIIGLMVGIIVYNIYIEYEYDNVDDEDKDKRKENMAPVDAPNTILPYSSFLWSPWWVSTRYTRNMSWDLRGDVPISPIYTGPFWNSPFLPYRYY